MAQNRYMDWFRQAENDWEWGTHSFESGHYSQTCFIAQQIGEKALKSLCFFRGFDVVKTHSVRKIAQELEINGEIEKIAMQLDLYYIPTRYPDSLPEGAPFESFTKEQAENALQQALQILNYVRPLLGL